MAVRSPDDIRNVCLISHSGAGKTSLVEAMLFDAGISERMGRVDDGNTTTDYDPEEQRRKISINLALAPCEWRGVKINLLDAPGYFDFVGEVRAGLRVSEGALLVLDAVGGVEVGTELVWSYAREYQTAVLLVVNKMDRENADFLRAVEAAREAFEARVIPLQIPIGKEESFRGVVDLVARKAYVFDGRAAAGFGEEEIPAELLPQVEEWRESVVEAAAEADDVLLEKYLEGEELSEEEIWAGLRRAVIERKVIPALCCSALSNIGVQPVLDACCRLLPAPSDAPPVEGRHPENEETVSRKPALEEPFSALVFKTVADPYVGRLSLFRVYSGVIRSDTHVYNPNKKRSERIGQLFIMRGKHQEPVAELRAGDLGAVAKLQETSTGDTLCDQAHPVVYPAITFPAPVFSVAVEPKSKGDEEKISSGLARLMEEDPTFRVEKNRQTLQTVISGMGEMHLDVITERLRRKFGVEVNLKTPKVPYKETIKSAAEAEGKHKKQTGGRGQYGHVFLRLEPLEPGKGFEFVDKIFGGAVPKQYIPAVEKGVRETMQEGVLAGYPVTDVMVTLYDGSYHPVDSSELAFKIAASLAFKKAFMDAQPTLLEPVMRVEVLVPERFMGDVIGDLNRKRGRILGMEPRGRSQVVRALVPLAEMFRYAIDLRSITQGRATYSMEFSHYEEVPANIAAEIIEKARKEKEEG